MLATNRSTESQMIRSNATADRRGARRIGVGLAVLLIVVAGAAWYWRAPQSGAQDIGQSVSPVVTAKPVSYPAAGKGPSARTEFPAGAAPISGAEIVAALSDHTALLPGGFVEYYAPDGKLHGLAEEKHYGGSWEVRNGTFCTLLEGGDESVCSPVERKGNTLYWSMDGEEEASPVSTLPGNPRNLR
jgi:hypothetical protein